MSEGQRGVEDGFGGSDIDPIELLRVAWARKFRILFVALIATAIGIGWAISQPRVYQADALVQIEKRQGTVSGLQELTGLGNAGGESTNTQIQILTSRRVLGEVVDRLDLTLAARPVPLPVLRDIATLWPGEPPRTPWIDRWIRPYAWSGEAITVARFSMDRDAPYSVRLTRDERPGGYTVRLPDGRVLDGRVGEMLRDAQTGLELTVSELEGEPGRTFAVARATRAAAIAGLRGGLQIQQQPGSEVLRMTYRAGSREEAVRRLDAVAEEFLTQNVARSAAETEQSLAFIEQQLPGALRDLETAQAEINAFRVSEQSIDLNAETQGLLNRVTSLRAELAQLDIREDEISRRYTRNHPVYQTLIANRAAYQEQLQMLEDETGTLPETQQRFFNLNQELEVAREIYLQLLNRQQELELVRAGTVGNVRILDTAQANPFPVAPNRTRAVALAFALGLLLAAGLVLARHLMRSRIDDIADLDDFSLPLYGVIKRLPGRRKVGGRTQPLMLDSARKQHEPVIEAFQSLRTALYFGMMDETPRAVVVSSASPGDGKSFVSANLAALSAKGDSSVCLVDADMRKGYLRRYFKLPRGTKGLSEYLSGQATLEEIVHEISPGLSVIAAGTYPPNPADLLMSARFRELVTLLGDAFDLTIYDAPPILAVTDPTIIRRLVPRMLCVIGHRRTERGMVEAMIRTLDKTGGKIDGLVLNDYQPGRGSGAEGQQYGYYYSSRYRYQASDKSA
ncbi:polysaccharide biosynthesis tyrosine autokinase [Roseobacter sp. HKCCA0434]|uniref:polysaccharide biosynthesis tyrosine autokinase n=1 Tax=Roseobacter sp. HKCCA0434 TaxID=3079297 RepID=UPI0029058F6F|nr:polysaccharide biosynthesis tyrosine autokinase [Roseobacter sp. HKCCA0434]